MAAAVVVPAADQCIRAAAQVAQVAQVAAVKVPTGIPLTAQMVPQTSAAVVVVVPTVPIIRADQG